ncbi:hypothetical protein SLEP1_g44739 [Rubroshorea leprosula]|uniref:Uncharacterized protein n=1 Tax=Rubroshorea leprosula TaxID=152421 RepID=A0AAV5LH60_9ROSI|nr:hypothetical protein SLEP1_g44739 [Rubroshorea leprosula]
MAPAHSATATAGLRRRRLTIGSIASRSGSISFGSNSNMRRDLAGFWDLASFWDLAGSVVYNLLGFCL